MLKVLRLVRISSILFPGAFSCNIACMKQLCAAQCSMLYPCTQCKDTTCTDDLAPQLKTRNLALQWRCAARC